MLAHKFVLVYVVSLHSIVIEGISASSKRSRPLMHRHIASCVTFWLKGLFVDALSGARQVGLFMLPQCVFRLRPQLSLQICQLGPYGLENSSGLCSPLVSSPV